MVLITKLDFTDFQNYREEFHKCLLLNNDNNKIKKIFVFVELNIDNLPKLSKVQYIVKRGYSSEQVIESVKKLTQEEKFIFSSPFYILGKELSQNEFQKNVTQKNNYSIFFRDTNYKLINLNPCHDGSLFNKKVNFTQILPKEEPNVIRKKGELVQTHIQSSNNNFNVIIVSVNYNDYLLVSLDQNIKIFQNITVVTSQEDVMCQRICEKFGVNCVITEKMYEDDAKFNKGKAINEGIKSISNPGWILLLDADIVVEGELSTENLDKSSLYTSDRYLCEEYSRFKSYKSGILHIESLGNFEPNRGLGFFQLFHTSKENRFPETSDDAAWSDLMFRDKFTSRKKIENRVIHLGQAYSNWEGRKTERFLTDGEFDEIYISSKKITNSNLWGVFKFGISMSKYGKLKINDQITFDYHNGGWTESLKSLYKVNSNDGIRTECFLEEKFCWKNSISEVISERWVGFLHIPIDTDRKYLKSTNSIEIFESEQFIKSLENCECLFVFSQYEKEKLSKKLNELNFTNIDIEVLRHPTKKSKLKWNYESFKYERNIVHIGWWMRDIQSFYEVKTTYKKQRLRLNEEIEKFISSYFQIKNLDVENLESVSPQKYDDILSKSVIFINLIDSVANNTILECIERQTPMIINRNRSVEEYLGEDYPLYYENETDIDHLLTEEILLKTHDYLKNVKVDYDLGKQVEKTEFYKKLSNVETLFLPGDFDDSEGGIYNPGFVRFQNKNIFFPRVEKFSEKQRGVNNLWKFTSASPTMVETDDNFKVISNYKLKINNWSGNRIEDFRLFEYNNKLYSNHIFVEDDCIYPVISEIDLDEREMKIKGKVLLDRNLNKVEKNWTFFSFEDKLYLLYKISPLTIYEVDIEKLTAKLIMKKDYEISWEPHGFISVSSNPIYLQDGNILVGIHTRTQDLTYHQGFVLLNEKFEIIDYTKSPIVSGGDFDGINKGVFYTMSLKEENDKIICFAGDGDYKSIIYKIKKSELWTN